MDEGHSKQPNNLFVHFPKFDLKFPFFNQNKEALTQSLVKEESKIAVVGGGQTENQNPKPNFVRFPNAIPVVPSPLDVELEESSGRTHNPVIIWQVYALGGFIILKWVWARWKERTVRAKKTSSDEDQSSVDYQSPADDNE